MSTASMSINSTSSRPHRRTYTAWAEACASRRRPVHLRLKLLTRRLSACSETHPRHSPRRSKTPIPRRASRRPPAPRSVSQTTFGVPTLPCTHRGAKSRRMQASLIASLSSSRGDGKRIVLNWATGGSALCTGPVQGLPSLVHCRCKWIAGLQLGTLFHYH